MNPYRRITHVIYDMDGLLLDTEPFYTQVSQQIAARYGKVFDWSVKSHMIGTKAFDSARLFIELLNLPISPEEYLRERKSLLEALFPKAEPLPGAVRLTRHLHRRGIAQAVATSSDHHNFELKTSSHKRWFSIFDCFVMGDDPEVVRGKPAPDIFLIAAARMHAAPERCLVFEDAPSGVTAAHAAGMPVVAVPDPNMNRTAYDKADQVIACLDEFEPEAWGLPPLRTQSDRR